MFSALSLARKICILVVAISGMAMSSVAEGVSLKSAENQGEVSEGLSVGIVARADADIQIRRIKTMMAERRTEAETEKDIEQLEKLQKILHGQN